MSDEGQILPNGSHAVLELEALTEPEGSPISFTGLRLTKGGSLFDTLLVAFWQVQSNLGIRLPSFVM